MELVLSKLDSPATTIAIPPEGAVVPVPKGQWYYGAVHTTIFLVEDGHGKLAPSVVYGGECSGPSDPIGTPGVVVDTLTLKVDAEHCVAWQSSQSEAVRWGCQFPLVRNKHLIYSAVVVCVRFLPSLHLNRAQVESMERSRMVVAHRAQDRPTDTSPA
jgi:hypothetical protein